MLMAAYRPRCPILAITREPQTARQLHLYRGVFPVLFRGDRNADWTEDMDQRINYAMEVRAVSRNLRYDTIRYGRLTCAQKLTSLI